MGGAGATVGGAAGLAVGVGATAVGAAGAAVGAAAARVGLGGGAGVGVADGAQAARSRATKLKAAIIHCTSFLIIMAFPFFLCF